MSQITNSGLGVEGAKYASESPASSQVGGADSELAECFHVETVAPTHAYPVLEHSNIKLAKQQAGETFRSMLKNCTRAQKKNKPRDGKDGKNDQEGGESV